MARQKPGDLRSRPDELALRHSWVPVNERWSNQRATEQGDEADEAFCGMVARIDMPPHARAGQVGRGHRFATYPRCSADPEAGGDDCDGMLLAPQRLELKDVRPHWRWPGNGPDRPRGVTSGSSASQTVWASMARP